MAMLLLSMVCGQKGDPDVWTGFRNIEFHTLNNKPSVGIIILSNVLVLSFFEKLDFRVANGYIPPGERMLAQ